MSGDCETIIKVGSLDALAEHGIKRAAIAVGVFDGVHLGHRRLLDNLLQMAARQEAEPAVFTFFPHPRAVLFPDKAPRLLVSPARKAELLAAAGIRAIVTVHFTPEFAALNPEEFIRDTLIAGRLQLCGICVGSAWRFGAGGRGTVADLKKFADAGHFEFAAIDELRIDGNPVSSTAIRRAVAAGRLDEAAALLGRPCSLSGRVVSGHRVATDELRFPTANLEADAGVLPPFGVYAVRVHLNRREYAGAANIGMSPTFNYSDLKHPRIEVHILDYQGDLYGQTLEIELLEYLRPERGFSGPDALRQQIAADIARIRSLFNTQP